MKAYTTIEESKRLIEAGLDVNTADMCYIQTPIDEYRPVAYNLEYCNQLKQQRGSNMNLIPCWSLAALLNIIDKNDLIYDISNDKNREYKIIVYNPDYIKQKLKFHHTEHTIVDMIIWLLENNYIKSNKNE